ncbi:MAG: hypothetical protein ACRERD_26955 [Candidatus Binatia bacterium]
MYLIRNAVLYVQHCNAEGSVDLENGFYEKLYVRDDGKPSYTCRLRLLDDSIALGDLNADGLKDAAIVIYYDGGGSGLFFELHLLVSENARFKDTIAHSLGDRVLVHSISIKSGKVFVDLTTHGPNDPLCCPTVRVTKAYRFGEGGSFSNPPGSISSPTTSSRGVDLFEKFGIDPFADRLPSHTTPSHTTQPRFTEPEQPLPYNGEVRRFTRHIAIAPFEIKSAAGSHYLVKLKDTHSGATILTVFVHGGSTVQIDVPLGNYLVEYAAGTKWYGYKHRFGPETVYNRADKSFRFEDHGYQVTGYTITLYRVAHGNLQTYAIRPEDF